MISGLLGKLLKDKHRGVFKSHGGFVYWVSEIIRSYLILSVVLGYNTPNPMLMNTIIGSSSMAPLASTYQMVMSSGLAYKFNQPKRGDFFCFSPSVDKSKIYMKLLVGLPGERIKFFGNTLFIDDKPVKLEYIKTYKYIEAEKEYDEFLYEMTFPDSDKKYEVLMSQMNQDFFNFRDQSDKYTSEYKLKSDEYFGIGVHMDVSGDSRMFGPIKKEQIKSKIIFFWFYNPKFPMFFLNPADWVKSIQWDKTFKWV